MKIAFFRTALIGIISVATMLAHETGPHEHEGASNLKTIRVTTAADGSVNPWNHLNFHNDPNAFQFAIVTDRTGGHRAGVFEDAIGKLNLLQPEFVMSVGDLIEGYTHETDKINQEWDEFEGFIEKLEMPFFYLPGNHDITNETMAEIWEQRFGRTHYSFIYRDVLFICLNTQDSSTHNIGKAQIEWARDTLAKNTEARWTLVFLHSPLWRYSDKEKRGWPQIEAALAGRKHTVFAGHYHSYLKNTINNANYYTLATTGGGSSLRGPAYGEFDQVAWVTMTKDGPIMANLLLDGILPEDVRTEEGKILMDKLGFSLMSSEMIWQNPEQPLPPSIELRSANPTEYPIDVSFEIEPTTGATIALQQGLDQNSTGSYRFTLQPHATVALNLALSGDLTLHPHQAASAGKIKWQALLQPENKKELRLHGSITLPILPKLRVQHHSDIRIDGDFQDWANVTWHDVSQSPFLRAADEGWDNSDDCRFQFSYARDDQNFYLAIEVRDEVLQSRPDQAPWMQDGIEIRMDFRSPDFHRKAKVWDGGTFFLGTSPAPGDGFDPTYVMNDQESLPSGTLICNRRVPGGYNLEIALPIASLKELHGDKWLSEGLRINIAINDRDNDSQQAQLWWQPDWRVNENILSSGTLFFED